MNAHLLRCCALYSAQKPELSLPHKDKSQHKGIETEVGRGKNEQNKRGMGAHTLKEKARIALTQQTKGSRIL